MGVDEIGPAKIGTAEIGFDENGPDEIGTAEIDPAKNGPAEIGLSEIGSAEIRLYIRVFFPPLIPYFNTLLEDFQVFRICHIVTWVGNLKSKLKTIVILKTE